MELVVMRQAAKRALVVRVTRSGFNCLASFQCPHQLPPPTTRRLDFHLADATRDFKMTEEIHVLLSCCLIMATSPSGKFGT